VRLGSGPHVIGNRWRWIPTGLRLRAAQASRL